jgi:ATP-dependent Clp protease ATP-binding subunit ClpA
MMITVPLYVNAVDGQFEVRPLFFREPTARAPQLERALHRVTQQLREVLHFLGKELRHDELARYMFNPELDYHRLDVAIDLRRRLAKSRFLFVAFTALERRIAFTPSLPELWFEVTQGQTLTGRANEVLSQHFREREKEDEERFVKPEELALAGSAWIHPLELDIHPVPKKDESKDRFQFLSGGNEQVDGERELFRVGRCLDHLYPDELDRVLLRDREISELTRLLTSPDRRPVLLLGPAQVGKTALLHEFVHRTMHERPDKQKLKELTFLISPQRLISGMSYVGQWENRLLAILKEARKKRHLLFFDDLLGLFHAGATCQSDLNVAHVLKPYVERRDIRLIAECTPEALRILRERDRGFADLFHIVPLPEPGESDTLRILIAAQRQLEGQHQCQFAVDTLPAVMDLQRRYARHLAFPGKAALFLRRLAVKHPKAPISRQDVLREFHLQSGLSVSFLDTKDKLERQHIMAALVRRIVGQRPALEAATDVISIAKARLNDPDRPLGTLLFLGPTGVGKTECAKAMAEFLFGDADKLVRFDMNEFVEQGSAARLVGTFWQPEGLLTSAIRRQPFAVVLLDEIEKAHPEVFDLCLQILGEGRLTDAHGRLVDFTNTIVVLTSNLGARRSASGFGFRQDADALAAGFKVEAERFFRPEFLNRLDRIVPFSRLSRADVGKIATKLIENVLQREGLARRRCLLQVEPEALERIVDQGFDPRFGARVLKRAIERRLTRAVATRIAKGLPDTFTHIHVYPASKEVAVHVQGLTQVAPNPPRPDLSDEEAVLQKTRRFAHRIMQQFEHLRPAGEIVATQRDHYAYFTLQGEIDQLLQWTRQRQNALDDAREASRRYAPRAEQFRTRPAKVEAREKVIYSNVLHELAAAQDIQHFLQEMADDAKRPSKLWHEDHPGNVMQTGSLQDLVYYAAYIQTLADCIENGAHEQAIVHLRVANPQDAYWLTYLAVLRYPRLFDAALGLETTPLKGAADSDLQRTLLVKGIAAVPLARLEEGIQLLCPSHGGIVPVQVMIWPVPAQADPLSIFEARMKQRQEWQEQLNRGDVPLDKDPFGFGSVVCLHQETKKRIDLRSGLVHVDANREWLLAALPLPREWSE